MATVAQLRWKRAKRIVSRVAFYGLLLVIAVYTIFPFYWAIVSSLKSGSDLFEVEYWISQPHWDNYVAVFREQPFGRNILNSLFVSVSTVTLSLPAHRGRTTPESVSTPISSRFVWPWSRRYL